MHQPFKPDLDQRGPVLAATVMFKGVAVEPDIPAPVGAAVAVSETTPRFDGFQEQVAIIFGELPVVDLFLHPGKILPLTIKVTFDATVMFAVITTVVRKLAVVEDPASENELKLDVSRTSVTVIVIDCVPTLSAESVAVRVISYTLLPPTSAGDSKFGEALNLMIAVSVSDLEILNLAASAPDEIVTVADSETRIVADVADVAMFSAAENEDEDVKVGGVVSGSTDPTVTSYVKMLAHTKLPELVLA